MNEDNNVNAIIETPREAKVISLMPTTRGQNDASVRVAVVTPEQGLLAADLKPLLDHYYNALHLQPSLMLAEPTVAFKSGYVLLNGTVLNKEHYPSWQKVVAAGLATEVDDELFKMKDFSNRYLRPQQTGVGTLLGESLPNITGWFSTDRGIIGSASGAFQRQTLGTQGVWTGIDPAHKYYHNAQFDASRSSATYKNGAKVVPESLVVYAYAFVGQYVGPPLPATTYYMLNPDKTYADEAITLPGKMGFTEACMAPIAPPTVIEDHTQKRSKNQTKYVWINNTWRLATQSL